MNGSTGNQPKPARPNLARLLGLLVIPTLLVVFTLALGRGSILNSSPQTRIYKFKDGTWSSTDALPGAAGDIQVSLGGVVWVSTSFHAGFSKTTDGHWTSYSGSDFGTTTNYMWGGFVLTGEDLWGATQEGVVHYDGKGWKLYKEALASDKPASIIAEGTRVWVIDDDGNFSIFDGSRWSIRSLKKEMPAVSWGGDMSFRRPALTLGPDRTVWLSWKGLWQLQGGRWVEVRPDGKSPRTAEFAGVTSAGVWIVNGTELIAIDAAGQVVTRVNKSDLGLGPAGALHRVAASSGSLLVATSEGLFQREARSWQKLSLPAAGVNNLDRIVVAPDSSVWVIGVLPMSASRFGPLFGMIALSIGGLVLMTRTLAKHAKGSVHRNTGIRETVQRSAGPLPESDEPILTPEDAGKKISPGKVSTTFIALLVVPAAVAVTAMFLLRRFRPDAPQWILPVAITVIGLMVGLIVTYRRAKKRGNSKPLGRRVLTALLTFAGIYLLEFVMRQGPKWIPGKHNWWWEIVGIVVIGLCAAVFLPLVGDLLPMWWAERALKRADYAGALRRVDLFWRLRPRSAGLLYTRGTILWLAGRAKEAEDALRESLAAGQKQAEVMQALPLENLACVLIEQGRYAEATKSLEGSIDILPDRGGPYVPLAEAYLRQKSEPEKALQFVDQAIALKEKSPMQKRVNRQAYADAWALRAWALGLLGRRAESDESIQRALSESDQKDKPNFAGTLYHLGQALLSQGNRSAAVEKFNEARKIDPSGNYGSLAASALREHSLWGDRA
ncbi:MAG TPA: tetratricopeptide repeat protein [Bryobacteraceae bacterium]|nr:tetratricopeptide repeat protein [Bryobacteraceae bacterium]